MTQAALQAEPTLQPENMNAKEAMPSKIQAQLSDKSTTVEEENSAKEESTALTPSANEALHPGSPSTRKRALPNPSTEEEPNSKKAKEVVPNGHATPKSPLSDTSTDFLVPKVNTETWQGFCEIESEPAYFSVILREMGVQHVTVREAFGMTPELLDMLPQPIYGVILLFRYREFGNEGQETVCPTDVWFANQLPAQNSCGTLAMINILMNSPQVDIGDHLSQFKEFTRDMTPFQRGEAFASFDFVKKIHNSFAKQMDVLENDKYISSKFKRAQYLKGLEGNSNDQTPVQPRRLSADSAASDDSAKAFENNAHHFIAFVPVGNEIWKLDGMDAQPTSVGTFNPEKGEDWLSGVSDTINTLMGAGDDDYGVVALTQSPVVSLRKKACLTINTVAHVESRLDGLEPTWKEFVADIQEPTSPRMLGVEEQLALYPVEDAVKAEIDGESLQELLERRGGLVEELVQVAQSIMEEMETEADEEQKAMRRRYDGGPAIKKWLEMLAENGYLEGNLSRFM